VPELAMQQVSRLAMEQVWLSATVQVAAPQRL
jgi:hypothetical protein